MTLRSERVILRETGPGDLPDLLSLWNDGRVMQWVGFPDGLDYDLAKLERWLRHLQSSPDRHHFIVHAERIGFCGEVCYAVDRRQGRAGLDIKWSPTDAIVNTDAARLRHVLINLISNAAKHGGGIIGVEVSPADETVDIEVLGNFDEMTKLAARVRIPSAAPF